MTGAYLVFVFFKNRNLKDNALEQTQDENRLLDGIGPQNQLQRNLI